MVDYVQSKLWSHDTLIMKSWANPISKAAELRDVDDQVVGRMTASGSGARRSFTGVRKVTIRDRAGRTLAFFSDPVNFGPDRFELHDSNGTQIAVLKTRLRFLSRRITIRLLSGPVVEMHREGFKIDTVFTAGGSTIARTTRELEGRAGGKLEKNRFALVFTPLLTPELKLAAIAGMLANDLLNVKRRRP